MKKTPEPLYGLVVFHSLKKMKTGATRSISFAAQPLQDLNIHLHFVAVRSILHFLYSFIKTKRYKYNFIIFNGLASIGHRSLFGYPLWRIAQIFNIPTFMYWHETDWVLTKLKQENPATAKKVERIATHPSTIHLTASKVCSQSIRKFYPNTTPVEVYECSVIPQPFAQPIIPFQPPIVVNLASIQKRKGTDLFVETAIKVCQQHPTVEFIWMGSGKHYGNCLEKIEAAGLQERILFPGYADSAYLILRRASVFFLSSRDDPFPLSILEAMGFGRSIVTFDVGGAPEALANYGKVIPPFDTNIAANTILELLAQPPHMLINPELHNRYLDLYTPEKFAIRLNNLIREYIL